MAMAGKMRSFLLLGGIVLSSLSLHAGKNETIFTLGSTKPAIYLPLEGKAWVEKCIEQHPEIVWLADVNVRKTEEGNATLQGSYSEQLFGQKFIEFDRTIMTLHCLKLILEGGDKAYQLFTAGQAGPQKLSKESFQTLHLQGARLLKSQWGGMSELEMAQTMETALVLGDMGKSEQARSIFKPHGVQAPDHDDFYGEAMAVLESHPELSVSFARLPSAGKKLLLKVANLAHYGHVTHLEGGAGMFTMLRESGIPSSNPVALSFDLFVHTCDVAGALGHVNNQSSLVYTEPAHKAMQAMGEAVRVLCDSNNTEWDAYNAYLTVRASWLGLNPQEKMDRVLARIGAMLRLFTPDEGTILRNAVLKLNPNDRARIIAQLDVQKDDPLSRTPTYMPAVLVNLSNNSQLGATKEERLFQAVALGLPFISRALEKYNDFLSKNVADSDVPLNFNKIAGVAKATPDLLRQGCNIDCEGNVLAVAE